MGELRALTHHVVVVAADGGAMAASSDAVGAVVRLLHKGDELQVKNCYARSVEKFSQAVVAAQAPQLPPDNIVVAHAQTLHASALACFAAMSGVQPAASLSAHLQAFEEVLPAAQAGLQRRRAAGTLFSLGVGEDALFRAFEAASTRQTGAGSGMHCSYGYAAFLRAATMALLLVVRCLVDHFFPLRDAALLQGHLTFAADALDLIHTPAACALNAECAMEACLVRMLMMIQEFGWLHQQPHGGVGHAFHVLRAPWRRLQRSGVLETGDLTGDAIDEELYELMDENDKIVAARIAAQGGLRACALPSCGAREAHAAHFKKCGACGIVVYCSKKHQTEHWPAHKAACKAARKAAAAVAAAEDDGGAAGSAA